MIIIAPNARLTSAPPAAIASVSTRGVICQETPHLSLHQRHALGWSLPSRRGPGLPRDAAHGAITSRPVLLGHHLRLVVGIDVF
jgi:hypothetical protein